MAKSLPKWIDEYRDLIGNTGGNELEDLYDCKDRNCNAFTNAPRALICVSVNDQVNLLLRLKARGLLGISEDQAKAVAGLVDAAEQAGAILHARQHRKLSEAVKRVRAAFPRVR